MVAAHNSSSSIVLVKERIYIIDLKVVQYMHHAERKCLCIKSGPIPFSPNSLIWIRRCLVYCSILRYRAGKIRNQINLKPSARRYRIGGPLQLSLKEVHDRLQVAHDKYEYFRRHGHRYRRKHLNNRLLRSQQCKDEESEKKILVIIHKKRFHLAEQASICKGQLRGDFGYIANTQANSQVLSGTYNYPPGCDPTTKELL